MKFQASVLVALLPLSSSGIFAAPTASVSVTGRILPANCNIAFADGGAVNYGDIRVADLKPDTSTSLPVKRMGWAISCSAPMAIAVSFIDNKELDGAWESADHTHFSIGKDSNNVPLGHLHMALGPGTPVFVSGGDAGGGRPVGVIQSLDKQAWGPAASGAASKTYRLGFGTPGATEPGAYQTYSSSFSLFTTIAPTQALDVSTTLDLAASVTMEIEYL